MKNQLENLKSIALDTGITLITFIFFNILVTAYLLFLKVSVSVWNLVTATILTIILLGYFAAKQEKGNKANHFFVCAICSFLLIFSTNFLAGKIHDNSWDGNMYHKTAIGALRDGWNPVYEDINDYKNLEVEFSEYHKYENTYGKASWFYAANIYTASGKIESGKSITLIVIMATFLIFFAYISSKLKVLPAIVISLLIALNPVIVAQIPVYYVDCLLGNCLYILILWLIIYFDESFKLKKGVYSLFFIVLLTILINLKFTGLAFAGIYCMIYFLYLLYKSFKRKQFKRLLNLTYMAVAALIVAIAMVGYSTYITNMVNHGHPMYPLFGENKVDIMTNNQPLYFENKSPIEKFVIANFSRTANISRASGLEAEYKLPFTFNQDEINLLSANDTRIAGYGVMFGGILILGLVLLILASVVLFKQGKKLTIILANLFTGLTLFLPFVMGDIWWARYYPQLYLIPISAIILALLTNKKVMKTLSYVIMILMIVNIYFFVSKGFESVKNNHGFINLDFDRLNATCAVNPNGVIYLNYTMFEGTIYNVNDYYKKYSYCDGVEFKHLHFTSENRLKFLVDKEFYPIQYGFIEVIVEK